MIKRKLHWKQHKHMKRWFHYHLKSMNCLHWSCGVHCKFQQPNPQSGQKKSRNTASESWLQPQGLNLGVTASNKAYLRPRQWFLDWVAFCYWSDLIFDLKSSQQNCGKLDWLQRQTKARKTAFGSRKSAFWRWYPLAWLVCSLNCNFLLLT